MCYVSNQSQHTCGFTIYIGAAGSRYPSIYDLTQHSNEWNKANNTGNYMPYSLRQVCRFFYVPEDCVNSKGLWEGAYGL